MWKCLIHLSCAARCFQEGFCLIIGLLKRVVASLLEMLNMCGLVNAYVIIVSVWQVRWYLTWIIHSQLGWITVIITHLICQLTSPLVRPSAGLLTMTLTAGGRHKWCFPSVIKVTHRRQIIDILFLFSVAEKWKMSSDVLWWFASGCFCSLVVMETL